MDLWALWPDGSIYPIEELAGLLSWKSDDFELVEVLDYYEDGEPSEWRKYGHSEDTRSEIYVHQPITYWGGDD